MLCTCGVYLHGCHCFCWPTVTQFSLNLSQILVLGKKKVKSRWLKCVPPLTGVAVQPRWPNRLRSSFWAVKVEVWLNNRNCPGFQEAAFYELFSYPGCGNSNLCQQGKQAVNRVMCFTFPIIFHYHTHVRLTTFWSERTFCFALRWQCKDINFLLLRKWITCYHTYATPKGDPDLTPGLFV